MSSEHRPQTLSVNCFFVKSAMEPKISSKSCYILVPSLIMRSGLVNNGVIAVTDETSLVQDLLLVFWSESVNDFVDR